MEGRGFAGFIVGAVGGLGVDSEGGVDELGGMVVGECVIGLSDGVSEGGVGAVGAEVVDIGVSDITGASWLGVNVIGVARLQPSSIVNINNTATKIPCFTGCLLSFYSLLYSSTRETYYTLISHQLQDNFWE
jgi:hypothetical protein